MNWLVHQGRFKKNTDNSKIVKIHYSLQIFYDFSYWEMTGLVPNYHL
jgi:hypothetical protein